jgi:hypothetical protein
VKLELDPKKTLAVVLTALFLLFAVWLVSPFFSLSAATEAHGRINSYRLFFGLMLLIGFVGKSLWDVLAPQGLAKKVSNTKAIALVALTILVMGFIVFTIARALSVYLDSSIAIDSANYLP